MLCCIPKIIRDIHRFRIVLDFCERVDCQIPSLRPPRIEKRRVSSLPPPLPLIDLCSPTSFQQGYKKRRRRRPPPASPLNKTRQARGGGGFPAQAPSSTPRKKEEEESRQSSNSFSPSLPSPACESGEEEEKKEVVYKKVEGIPSCSPLHCCKVLRRMGKGLLSRMWHRYNLLLDVYVHAAREHR